MPSRNNFFLELGPKGGATVNTVLACRFFENLVIWNLAVMALDSHWPSLSYIYPKLGPKFDFSFFFESFDPEDSKFDIHNTSFS